MFGEIPTAINTDVILKFSLPVEQTHPHHTGPILPPNKNKINQNPEKKQNNTQKKQNNQKNQQQNTNNSKTQRKQNNTNQQAYSSSQSANPSINKASIQHGPNRPLNIERSTTQSPSSEIKSGMPAFDISKIVFHGNKVDESPEKRNCTMPSIKDLNFSLPSVENIAAPPISASKIFQNDIETSPKILINPEAIITPKSEMMDLSTNASISNQKVRPIEETINAKSIDLESNMGIIKDDDIVEKFEEIPTIAQDNKRVDENTEDAINLNQFGNLSLPNQIKIENIFHAPESESGNKGFLDPKRIKVHIDDEPIFADHMENPPGFNIDDPQDIPESSEPQHPTFYYNGISSLAFDPIRHISSAAAWFDLTLQEEPTITAAVILNQTTFVFSNSRGFYIREANSPDGILVPDKLVSAKKLLMDPFDSNRFFFLNKDLYAVQYQANQFYSKLMIEDVSDFDVSTQYIIFVSNQTITCKTRDFVPEIVFKRSFGKGVSAFISNEFYYEYHCDTKTVSEFEIKSNEGYKIDLVRNIPNVKNVCKSLEKVIFHLAQNTLEFDKRSYQLEQECLYACVKGDAICIWSDISEPCQIFKIQAPSNIDSNQLEMMNKINEEFSSNIENEINEYKDKMMTNINSFKEKVQNQITNLQQKQKILESTLEEAIEVIQSNTLF